MTNFAIFALIWPVVGTLLVIGFGLFLARRTRILHERTQTETARFQAQNPPGAAKSGHQTELQISDA